jgi:hypothetical protein
MEDLANDYAMALAKEFGGRVGVVGISTIRAEDAFDIGGNPRFGKDVLAFLLADQTDALRSGSHSVLTG